MSSDSINRVAIYTRVSTDDQADSGLSLSNQLESLNHCALGKGWKVQDIYVEEGVSGRTIKRPQYQRMMTNMDQWDAILVYKMDRIHRSSKNFTEMMDFLAKNKKDFVSNMESLDTGTAMGRFVMDIIQRIAQLESEQIGERTYVAMKQRAKTSIGEYNGHLRPYGYTVKDHKLVAVPGELSIVKKAFELKASGLGLNAVAKELGLKFSNTHYILHNPIYTGYEQFCYWFKKVDVEPVISVELFNQVQRMMIEACPAAKKRGLRPLQLKNLVSWEIPEADRDHISNTRCRAPKHDIN